MYRTTQNSYILAKTGQSYVAKNKPSKKSYLKFGKPNLAVIHRWLSDQGLVKLDCYQGWLSDQGSVRDLAVIHRWLSDQSSVRDLAVIHRWLSDQDSVRLGRYTQVTV